MATCTDCGKSFSRSDSARRHERGCRARLLRIIRELEDRVQALEHSAIVATPLAAVSTTIARPAHPNTSLRDEIFGFVVTHEHYGRPSDALPRVALAILQDARRGGREPVTLSPNHHNRIFVGCGGANHECFTLADFGVRFAKALYSHLDSESDMIMSHTVLASAWRQRIDAAQWRAIAARIIALTISHCQ